jgi:transposase-like protein
MGRKSSYTLEYKMRLLSDYHVSNLSMAVFCGRNGIKVSTLEYWLRKETDYSVEVNAAPSNRQNLIDDTG